MNKVDFIKITAADGITNTDVLVKNAKNETHSFLYPACEMNKGAFISRIADGEDPEEAMEFASKSAAITVTRNGAQSAIPYKDEVDKWKT